MKKNYLSLVFLSILISGCSVSQPTSNSSNVDGVGLIKEKTEIQFLCLTDDKYKVELERMVNEFKEIEPNVSVLIVNPVAAGNYNVLEKNVIAGFFKNDYPDIVQCYPDNVVKYINYNNKNYAINLDPYLSNNEYGLKEDKVDYIETFLNEGSNYHTEGTYSLPFCKSTELMYYNADVLLNLDLSTIDPRINDGKPLDHEYLNNLSWEEMFEKLCPAIKTYNNNLSEDKKIYKNTESSGIVTYDSDDNFFITLANQYGCGYTSMDDEGNGKIEFNNIEMKKIMLKLKSAKDKGYLQTKGSYGDYVSSLFTNRESLFTISSTAGLSYNIDSRNPFNLGVARLPSPTGRPYSAINQGPSVCILDHFDKNRSLASFLFWKYITNANNSLLWALNTGYMSIRNSVYETEEYKAALNVKDDASIEKKALSMNLKMIGEVSSYTFNTPVFKGSSDARTEVGLLVKECLLDNDLENNIDSIFAHYEELAKSHL